MAKIIKVSLRKDSKDKRKSIKGDFFKLKRNSTIERNLKQNGLVQR